VPGMTCSAVLGGRLRVVSDAEKPTVDHVPELVNQCRFLAAITLGADGDSAIDLAFHSLEKFFVAPAKVDEALHERATVAEIDGCGNQNAIGREKLLAERTKLRLVRRFGKILGERKVIYFRTELGRRPERRGQRYFRIA